MREIISPQIENGHIDIANEIAEAFYLLQLSGNQWRVLWVIIRQSWGWHKKVERITISFIAKKTGLKRSHIARSLKELTERNIVTKIGNIHNISYGLNKHYNKWKVLPNKTLLPKLDKSVTKNEQQMLPKMSDIYIKETIIKETIKENTSFDKFWKAYPRKVEKSACLKKWLILNPSAELLQQILTAIEKQKLWRQNAQNGDFRPEWKHPLTWLNKGCWEDEVDIKPSKVKFLVEYKGKMMSPAEKHELERKDKEHGQ